jgi:nitroimidazol reductase NimA-like FMN-containing flavoprotein (pyridoxamine 5'-phosphate oxidase superfamily)
MISEAAKKFLLGNEIAVLSTISRSGQVQGATVYYHFKDGYIYILTKSDSAKAHSMMAHSQVAITVYDSDEIKTIQLQGEASIEGDLETKRQIFDLLVRPREYSGEKLMPPVTQLSAGSFITFRIRPTEVHYSDYNDKSKLTVPRTPII